MNALRCDNTNVLIEDDRGEIRGEARGSYKQWKPDAREQAVIDLGLTGKKPSAIAITLANVTSDFANDVLKKARRYGYAVPSTRGVTPTGPRPKYIYDTKKPAPDAKPQAVRPPVPCNHSELAALKKLLGDDRATIEQAADEEGVSLEAYVKARLAEHAKDLRG